MPLQWIRAEDYIKVVALAAPRIKALAPGAKIVVGSASGMDAPECRDWLLTLLENDQTMALADVVAWHPFFGASPGSPQYRDYYAAYPAFVRLIQQTARAHGFRGQFRADEMVWRSPDCWWCAESDPLYSDAVAAKYYARGIVMHLGLDVGAGLGGMGSSRQSARVVKNLATLMAGAHAESFPISLTTTLTNVVSYTLSLPGNERVVSLWNDGIAIDDDPGVESTLRLPGLADSTASGVDIMLGLQQQLIATVEGDDLVISGLRIRDYPLLVRLTPPQTHYLPLVKKD